jgi:inner membrane protein
MAAARIYGRGLSTKRAVFVSMLVWSALAFLPDADVLGFRFGIRYADPWGHRGATHSFAFALALAMAIGVCAPLLRLSPMRTGAFAAVVISSHAILDTLTDGGLGCALWWPFDNHRYFAPWNPIPVSPIGLGFFSRRGFSVALAELLLFSPLFFYAMWPRKSRARI